MGSKGPLMAMALLLLSLATLCHGGVTSNYVRKSENGGDMPFGSDIFRPPPGYNAPEQVHITQGDYNGKSVIVSWTTPEEAGSDLVLYGTKENKTQYQAHATVTTYNYSDYRSGYIHHCFLNNLEYDTQYFYEVGIGESSRQFWFTTPPAIGPDVPYKFGLIGDLGQTFDSNQTLSHYDGDNGQALLFLGDLAYQDHYYKHDNRRWDTWERFVERNAAYQPWIWVAGNHEIDYVPWIGETSPFRPYLNRFATPYKASQSTSPLWYSVRRASAHIIVLSSYSSSEKYMPQYEWLKQELPKVNRTETPWLIVLVHTPWYSTFQTHYMEGESMRVQFESWIVEHKVDLVFAGHVHAYERSKRISNIAYNIQNKDCSPVPNEDAPVYVTVGDGGNIEGLVWGLVNPQPDYSAFRESSFGHATLEIKNRTHAYYSWHRNANGVRELGDSVWFYNRVNRPYE